jgi:nicotinamide riboside kinase
MAQNSILKIGIVGAESTGKTELCEALAKHYKTVWVPEFARAYFNHSDIYNYSLKDLETIAKKQVELEEKALKNANTFLFCDTTLITLKIWAELEFKIIPSVITEMLTQSHYDYYLICNNDVHWMKDEQRQNKFSRDTIFEMNLKEVVNSETPYFIVEGLGQERIDRAVNIINQKKFSF